MGLTEYTFTIAKSSSNIQKDVPFTEVFSALLDGTSCFYKNKSAGLLEKVTLIEFIKLADDNDIIQLISTNARAIFYLTHECITEKECCRRMNGHWSCKWSQWLEKAISIDYSIFKTLPLYYQKNRSVQQMHFRAHRNLPIDIHLIHDDILASIIRNEPEKILEVPMNNHIYDKLLAHAIIDKPYLIDDVFFNHPEKFSKTIAIKLFAALGEIELNNAAKHDDYEIMENYKSILKNEYNVSFLGDKVAFGKKVYNGKLIIPEPTFNGNEIVFTEPTFIEGNVISHVFSLTLDRDDFNEIIKKNSDFMRYFKTAMNDPIIVATAVAADFDYSTLPKEMKCNYNVLKSYINSKYFYPNFIPQEIFSLQLKIKRISADNKEYTIKNKIPIMITKKCGIIMNTDNLIPDFWYKDMSILHAALKKDPTALLFFPPEKINKSIIKKSTELHRKNNEVANLLIHNKEWKWFHVFWFEVIKKHDSGYARAPECLKNKKYFVYKAVSHHPRTFTSIPDEFKYDYELICKIIKRYPHLIYENGMPKEIIDDLVKDKLIQIKEYADPYEATMGFNFGNAERGTNKSGGIIQVAPPKPLSNKSSKRSNNIGDMLSPKPLA